MIGIIGAMESEVSLYKEVLRNIDIKKIGNFEFYQGTINNIEVCVVKCGIGKVLSAVVTTLMINFFKPKLIINTGIAGGFKLKSNDLFLAKNYIYGDFNLEIFNYKKGQVPGFSQYFYANENYYQKVVNYFKNNNIAFKTGLNVTQDCFVTSKNQLIDFNEEIATDMEACAIAHSAKCFNTPFISLRVISDVIDEENQISNYEEFESLAAKRSSEITIQLLEELI